MISPPIFAKPNATRCRTSFRLFRLLNRSRIPVLAIVAVALSGTVVGQSKPAEVVDASLTPSLTQADVMNGWISLFDGKTLYGWKSESNANWSIKDGTIYADKGEMGLLRTTTQFDDYEIRLEFQSSPTTNSGLFLRTSPKPKNPKDDCFELNIAQPDQNPFPTGSLVFRERSKSELKLNPNEWNRYRAVVVGNCLRVWVNDEPTMVYYNPKPLGRGFIGLQFREGPIAFRNIALKPMKQRSLFNGKDLTGWNTDKKMASQFTVNAEGELHMTNGQGQLESETQWGDFVLTSQCKTNAANLNSGIFFRCIPNDLMNGYESQIHNGCKNGNPSDPANCGTGGIFRRKNARRVCAVDNKWFTKTIVAVGPHFSVWVNGYQVCDWTDKRQPDANPRKGLRLEKGTIALQGHDPTTDVLFRQIKAKEIVKRFPNDN